MSRAPHVARLRVQCSAGGAATRPVLRLVAAGGAAHVSRTVAQVVRRVFAVSGEEGCMLLVASGSGGRRAHILRQADKRRETRGRRATSGEWTQSAYQGTGSDQRSRQPARPLRVLICAPSSALRHLRSVICASSCSICAGCSSPRAADNQCASRGTHTHTHARSDRCVRTHRPPPAAPCVHTRTPAGPRGGSLCRTRKGPLCTYSRRIATPWATRGQDPVCRNPTVYEPRRARGV